MAWLQPSLECHFLQWECDEQCCLEKRAKSHADVGLGIYLVLSLGSDNNSLRMVSSRRISLEPCVKGKTTGSWKVE